jgi:hypothetical protein
MYSVSTTPPESNCRQSQGAYWCPGSFFPSQFVPSSVDQIFDSDQQGYQGGEALAMAEASYGVAVDSQFLQLSQWGKGALGGGEAQNRTDRNLRSKPESGTQPEDLRPGEDKKSDGVYDAEHPGEFFPIGDGMRAVFMPDGSVGLGLTGRAQLFASMPGGHDVVPGLVVYGGRGKNQWVGINSFLSNLYSQPTPDYSWNPFFTQSWSPR